MLKRVQPYMIDLCRVMSDAIGVNLEIVDSGLTRLAGTGIYAGRVDERIGPASGIYRTVLGGGGPVFVDNPREHPACADCLSRGDCRELLNMCAPVELDGEILGVIGLVCFEEDERKRVADKERVFRELVVQLAGAVARRAAEEVRTREIGRTLDALLEVSDFNEHGVVLVSRDGLVTHINRAAASELGLEGDPTGLPVRFRDTGDNLADLSELEVGLAGRERVVFGRTRELRSGDPAFHTALLIEPVPRLSEMLSGSAAESPGGLAAIVGGGVELARLKERVLKIAATPSTVLITGESGTGKEMFARAIHAESPRRSKPFVAINCGAIPDELLESELFGYVKGAFTGASQTGRMGKFELANGGVVFLDEISSMSLYLQVKLLRVLQERSFTRLGSNRQVTVDVRVIAATNDDLPKMIGERRFRGDLFFRLNVIPLELPPLRRRKEDIPILAEHFLDRYCRRFAKPPARLTPQILEVLTAYDWPGNVREFENCVEYMINLHEGGPLSLGLVPPDIREAVRAAGTAGAAEASRGPAPRPEPLPALLAGDEIIPLERLELEAILRAIERCGDTAEGKRQAARALGVSLATLYRRLKAIGR